MSRLGVLSNLQTKIAHTSTIPALGNKDLRLLQEWITAEKGVINSLQRLVGDLDKANEALTHWGGGEGADLGDVLSRSRDLLSHASIAFGRFAEHEGAMRSMLKGIRSREEALDDAKKRRRNLVGKAEAAQKKLSKMGQENKQLPQQTELLSSLRQEIAQLDGFIYNEEAAIMDFKRRTTKDVMGLKFGGLAELAEKITIVGTLGKDLIEEIPLDATVPGQMRAPYTAFDKTRERVEHAARCINSVAFNPVPAETLPPKRPDTWQQQQSYNGLPEASEQETQGGGAPQVNTPDQEEPLSPASPQRPELPHHLPSNVGLPSPVDLSSSTSEWMSPGVTNRQPSPLSIPPSGPGFSEFGQLSGHDSGRAAAAATFPIAAAHSRSPDYLIGAGTVGGRPSSLAYLQDTPPGSATQTTFAAPTSPSVGHQHLRKDSQPSSPMANPWTDSSAQAAPAEQEPNGTSTGSRFAGRRTRSRDDYHYEYSDNAFWVRNNVPATRESPREEVEEVLPSDASKEAGTAPLAPPQAPAMFGNRNRSSSSLAAGRSSLGGDEAGGRPLATPPRIDVSPAPSSRSLTATATSPDAPRTIAASAFRRTPRASSESVNETAPLHVRKRVPLPDDEAQDEPPSPPYEQVPTAFDAQSGQGQTSEVPPPFSSFAVPEHAAMSPSAAAGPRRLPVPPSTGQGQAQYAPTDLGQA